MQSPSAFLARVCHWLVLSALLLGVCAMLSARANYRRWRETAARNSQLTVVLDRSRPEAEISQIIESVGEIEGVSEVRLLDLQRDLAPLFEDSDRIAEQYRDLQQSAFLPPLLEVRLSAPFSSEAPLPAVASKIKALEPVQRVDYPKAAYMGNITALSMAGRGIRFGFLLSALFLIAGAAALEWMRECAQQWIIIRRPAAAPKTPWLIDRLILAVLAIAGGTGAAWLLIAAIGAAGAIPLVFLDSAGLVSLLILGLVVPPAAAALIRAAFPAIQAPKPKPAVLTDEEPTVAMPDNSKPTPAQAASARQAYERQQKAAAGQNQDA